jgi:hypothetical protein
MLINLKDYSSNRGIEDHANAYINEEEPEQETANEEKEEENGTFSANNYWKKPDIYSLNDLLNEF